MGSQPWIIPAIRKVGKGHLASVLTLANADRVNPSATAAAMAVSWETLLSWAVPLSAVLGSQPALLCRVLRGWDLSIWVQVLSTFPGRAVASVTLNDTIRRFSTASLPKHWFERQSYSRAHHL